MAVRCRVGRATAKPTIFMSRGGFHFVLPTQHSAHFDLCITMRAELGNKQLSIIFEGYSIFCALQHHLFELFKYGEGLKKYEKR